MKPKAVLFDLDGTILPFDGIIRHIQLTCKHFNVRVPTKKELMKYIIGYTLKECIPVLIPETKRIIEEFKIYFRSSYNSDVASIKPFPFVKKVFIYIKKRGIKIGIVTTKQRRQAEVTLKYYKLPYDVLIGFDDVKRRKPHPEPVLKACRILKVKPEECIFFGDHPFDMEAAKSAGCLAVGVLSGYGKRNNLKKSGANFIIKDLRGLKKLIK